MELKHYQPELYNEVAQIEVSDGDRKFTRTPLHNIELAQKDAERYPILVYDHGQCIGFFTLHVGRGVSVYTRNSHAIFFRSFSIDKRYRGKGLGKKVLRLLPQFIYQNFPRINEIYLTVNDDNEVAQKLYYQLKYERVGNVTVEGRPNYLMRKEI
ncbi:GNAT family N-acetyltransferase [Staphylococcus sp. SQ8-PEA]|uniref:GNAT family N-acetyltransferase n=1 Tax=Staphylococcus marylandisciuri TaxID=2981529 RepID=A0ABT2QSN6_9STAP|nr:GNAT family N-acetyltransferase [Staphylococcus marylandisciuri]MCU5746992.1 GNAT family N-acetyltransferase [Staphylococcus marylandisciuri]